MLTSDDLSSSSSSYLDDVKVLDVVSLVLEKYNFLGVEHVVSRNLLWYSCIDSVYL